MTSNTLVAGVGRSRSTTRFLRDEKKAWLETVRRLGNFRSFVLSGEIIRLNDYWLLRTYARWEMNDHLAFTFRVENLSDQHYYTTVGYPALATTVFGGAEGRF